ncbi:DedA family protein [Micromonospora andamanensis]|uniref:Uncharacterized protein n=1 Tax=Micromonospora andamanensis TaxID=1287068 RepID=A0ABQ4I2F5_9ACTN|nr:hypothetical protein Van01_52670 [Micromonospora andamanensis]GIJ43085.1 hypothetical protein Vwe01_64100 [Micromonospora andamanensis]
MDMLSARKKGLAVALENPFPPHPGEIILPLAAFAASRGEMSLWSAIFWTTLPNIGSGTLSPTGRRLLG